MEPERVAEAKSTADYLEVFHEGGGSEWSFRAKSNNGDVLAWGTGYDSKRNAERAATGLLPGVPIKEPKG